jgi:hypothetical protein
MWVKCLTDVQQWNGYHWIDIWNLKQCVRNNLECEGTHVRDK